MEHLRMSFGLKYVVSQHTKLSSLDRKWKWNCLSMYTTTHISAFKGFWSTRFPLLRRLEKLSDFRGTTNLKKV